MVETMVGRVSGGHSRDRTPSTTESISPTLRAYVRRGKSQSGSENAPLSTAQSESAESEGRFLDAAGIFLGSVATHVARMGQPGGRILETSIRVHTLEHNWRSPMLRRRSARSRLVGLIGIGFAATVVILLVTVSLTTGAPQVIRPAIVSSTSTCHATINQVSGLSDLNLSHTIVIIGTCFGSDPTYVNVSSFNFYTGMDTQNCGSGPSPPTMSIGEWGAPGNDHWSAGRFVATDGQCLWGDGIGLFYKTWTPTKIVIEGFGNALGTATQNPGAPYQMTPHAECSVYIRNPANEKNPANYTMPRGTC
jgi:hypothetical protein